MSTEKGETLQDRAAFLDVALKSGLSPFVALAASLDDDDWPLVVDAFRARVQALKILKKANRC